MPFTHAISLLSATNEGRNGWSLLVFMVFWLYFLISRKDHKNPSLSMQVVDNKNKRDPIIWIM